MNAIGTVRRRLLGISAADVSFARLGFEPCDAAVQQRLERVMASFAEGFGIALQESRPEDVDRLLRDRFDDHHLGFAFEGAGMFYALGDLALPWGGGRLRRVTDSCCAAHDFIMTVGAGFAVARLPWGRRALDDYLDGLDPMIAWCVPDGYGFHEGLFRRQDYILDRRPPAQSLPPYARPLFDSGLGRSLWWSEGAHPERIADRIDSFPESRQAEMWCGVGVACAYCCGVDDAVIHELSTAAGHHRAHLLCGAPFAACMRQRGGNPSAETERVCQHWLGTGSDAVADWAFADMERVAAHLPPAVRRVRCYGALRAVLARQLERGSLPSTEHTSTRRTA